MLPWSDTGDSSICSSPSGTTPLHSGLRGTPRVPVLPLSLMGGAAADAGARLGAGTRESAERLLVAETSARSAAASGEDRARTALVWRQQRAARLVEDRGTPVRAPELLSREGGQRQRVHSEEAAARRAAEELYGTESVRMRDDQAARDRIVIGVLIELERSRAAIQSEEEQVRRAWAVLEQEGAESARRAAAAEDRPTSRRGRLEVSLAGAPWAEVHVVADATGLAWSRTAEGRPDGVAVWGEGAALCRTLLPEFHPRADEKPCFGVFVPASGEWALFAAASSEEADAWYRVAEDLSRAASPPPAAEGSAGASPRKWWFW
eukprot:TRINITY_DN15100_c1_g1_i2.p3 TRINITY_DN15100_c1_g1~~TRINITY_DN15100_c1_g1_i2.p3  ORF type:complete len:321 (+),score=101.39 TRINITY_DN15100_c1_g1_i2:1500-2462(+)